ncbi:RXLR domain-containing protein [Phytophthora infestans]|uniref:RxLR effector protein n=1 Tax=Phytophthora infestans TaxID=4787 RepID=A0A833WK27_PHYIN|nr:RXLR domain-containing protein [Phytophthora infestans]
MHQALENGVTSPRPLTRCSSDRDAVDRRFLREREESMEEREFHLTTRAEVKALARKVITDFDDANDVYRKWYENGYSKNKIANLLKVSEKEKYAPVYNGYLAYLNRINS